MVQCVECGRRLLETDAKLMHVFERNELASDDWLEPELRWFCRLHDWRKVNRHAISATRSSAQQCPARDVQKLPSDRPLDPDGDGQKHARRGRRRAAG